MDPTPDSLPDENRLMLVAAYYNVQPELIQDLVALSPEKRKVAARILNIDPSIIRTMMDYTRYPEAGRLHQKLNMLGVDVSALSSVDFGCLVADYAIYFARLGSRVTVYDTREILRFVAYRFKSEHLRARMFARPTDYRIFFRRADLVMFGEVLEHMHYPINALKACVNASVQYVYTSCYPFGDDAYFSLPGHRKSAQRQQQACRDLLNAYYNQHVLWRKAVLWVKQ